MHVLGNAVSEEGLNILGLAVCEVNNIILEPLVDEVLTSLLIVFGIGSVI